MEMRDSLTPAHLAKPAMRGWHLRMRMKKPWCGAPHQGFFILIRKCHPRIAGFARWAGVSESRISITGWQGLRNVTYRKVGWFGGAREIASKLQRALLASRRVLIERAHYDCRDGWRNIGP